MTAVWRLWLPRGPRDGDGGSLPSTAEALHVKHAQGRGCEAGPRHACCHAQKTCVGYVTLLPAYCSSVRARGRTSTHGQDYADEDAFTREKKQAQLTLRDADLALHIYSSCAHRGFRLNVVMTSATLHAFGRRIAPVATGVQVLGHDCRS